MAGEIWLTETRTAKEVTYGTPVTPATRKLYLRNPVFNDPASQEFHDFATGTPDNVRAVTTNSREPTGKAELPVGSDELVEWLLITLKGSVTPTMPAGGTLARDWVFTPDAVVDSLTAEWYDGARGWQAAGVRGNGLQLAGEVGGDHLVSLDLFAADLVQAALTGSPPDRVPSFMRGWEQRIYVGAFGADPATLGTISGFLKKYTVKIDRNLGRKYLANNTQAMAAAVMGAFGATADLTIEAANAQALTEWNAYRAGTRRILRLELGNNEQIEASPTNEVQTIATTGAPTGGSFTVVFRGITSGAIAYNATAAQVQAVLEAMAAIGRGNVACTGGALPTAVNVAFQNQLGGENVPQFTLGTNSLTGGSSPAPAFATTTPGVGYKRLIWLDLPGAWESFSLGEEDAGTRMYKGAFRYIYDPTNGYSCRLTLRTGRATAF